MRDVAITVDVVVSAGHEGQIGDATTKRTAIWENLGRSGLGALGERDTFDERNQNEAEFAEW